MRRVLGCLTALLAAVAILLVLPGSAPGSADAGGDAPTPGPVAPRTVVDRTVREASTPKPVRGNPLPTPYGLRVPHLVRVVMPTNLGAFPYTPEEAASAVDQVLAWWRASIPNAFVSLALVAGPIPYTATTLPGPPECGTDTGQGIKEAEQVAGAVPKNGDGVADHVVILLPPACARGSAGMPSDSYDDGWTYIAPRDIPDLPLLLEHELGHNFGFNHANRQCADCVYPFPSVLEYGDCYSIMGQGKGVVSTAARAQGGLLLPGEMLSLDGDDGPVNQSVVLAPRGSESGQRGLAVTDSETGQTWYLDYRSNTGLDDQGSPAPCPAGVTVNTIGAERTTLLIPRAGVPSLQSAASSWQPGDVIELSPNVTVTVGQLDPVSGAQLSVSIQSPPPFTKVPSARLTGMKSMKGVAKVQLGTFSPEPSRLVYHWYLNGEPLRDVWGDPADVPRMSMLWGQGRLQAEVTAFSPGHRRVVVWTPVARVLPNLNLPNPRLRGVFRVGHRVTVTIRHRPSLPGRLKVHYTWRVGNIQQPVDGPSLNLTQRMLHLKIQVTVLARAKGYRWTQMLTNLSKPVEG